MITTLIKAAILAFLAYTFMTSRNTQLKWVCAGAFIFILR